MNKSMVKQCLMQELSAWSVSQGGQPVQTVQNIEECPQMLRHACMNGGIQFLDRRVYNFQTEMGLIQINYYFCMNCGKLFIDNDFGMM